MEIRKSALPLGLEPRSLSGKRTAECNQHYTKEASLLYYLILGNV